MGKMFLPVIFAGTLLVWVFFRYATPDATLDLNDTVIVAAAVSILVLGGNWLRDKFTEKGDS